MKPRRNLKSTKSRKSVKPPRTAKQFFAMPEAMQIRVTNVQHVISTSRYEKKTPRTVARELGVKFQDVITFGKPALRKARNGRWVVKSKDTLLRVLVIPQPDGPMEIAVRDSEVASTIGQYNAAVKKYLQTGDSSGFKKFKRMSITDADGIKVKLLTDLAELDRLGAAGQFTFESIYARVA